MDNEEIEDEECDGVLMVEDIRVGAGRCDCCNEVRVGFLLKERGTAEEGSFICSDKTARALVGQIRAALLDPQQMTDGAMPFNFSAQDN
jgi:hypothetical protein